MLLKIYLEGLRMFWSMFPLTGFLSHSQLDADPSEKKTARQRLLATLLDSAPAPDLECFNEA